uniref:Methyltransferase FkbM domain-containing protein n=2 Tax=Chaetoceros debilis TaxID=122233 RepID=A0A7S3V498_9STRA|mmetsp:Transcript_19988/g.30260  ORF Transcript_19988/g.30260 Transcript_19988/m.30260 type:complete len:357 (+) Transcript_19988:160-1230(+)
MFSTRKLLHTTKKRNRSKSSFFFKVLPFLAAMSTFVLLFLIISTFHYSFLSSADESLDFFVKDKVNVSARIDSTPKERKLKIKSNTAIALYESDYNYKPPENSFDLPVDNTVFAHMKECGYGPDFGKYFTLNDSRRSNTNEDKKIYERFFKKRIEEGDFNGRGGTFIELGAFDGLHETNSRFYEACLGWEGLLIEGNPVVYEALLANRPSAHRMSLAPSCKEKGGRVQFADVAVTNAGLPGHAKDYDKRKTFVDVPCGPLGPILQDVFEESSGRIDYMSLDVEGAEALVLNTIDFEKIRIDVAMIEVENSFCIKNEPCEVRDQVRKIMKEAGYIQKYGVVRRSDVWVHPDSPYHGM